MLPQIVVALALLTAPHTLAVPPTGANTADLLSVLNKDHEEEKRLEAFKKLEALSAIDARQICRSITDTSAAVRAQAVRVGEPLAATDPELELRLLALAYDKSPLVRLQMLSTLPTLRHPHAQEVLLYVISAEIENPKAWPLAVVALNGRLGPHIQALISDPFWKKQTPGRQGFLEFAANALRETGAGDSFTSLLELISDDEPTPPRWMRLALLRGLLGQFSGPERPAVLKPLHLTEIPVGLRPLLASKDSVIRKLIKAPGALLSWPAQP